MPFRTKRAKLRPETALAYSTAVRETLGRALADLAAGRSAEALRTLRALETLARFAEARPDAVPLTEQGLRAELAALRGELAELKAAAPEERRREVERALAVLDAPAPKLGDPGFGWWEFRLRAERLGPEVARADWARSLRHLGCDRIWTVDGRLKPPPLESLKPPAAPAPLPRRPGS